MARYIATPRNIMQLQLAQWQFHSVCDCVKLCVLKHRADVKVGFAAGLRHRVDVSVYPMKVWYDTYKSFSKEMIAANRTRRLSLHAETFMLFKS